MVKSLTSEVTLSNMYLCCKEKFNLEIYSEIFYWGEWVDILMTVLCLWLRVTDVTYFLSNGSDQEAMNVIKCSDWSFLFLVVLNLVDRTSCDTMNKNTDLFHGM